MTNLTRAWRIAVSLSLALMLPSIASAETFRVASYNLNWGNRRGDQVIDAIKTAAPDLICFQETTVQSERFLRERLAPTFPHFYAVGHHGRYAGERFAFASKSELTDLTFSPPVAGLFGFYSARYSFAGTSIQIVNVHLTPIQIQRDAGFSDVMSSLAVTEDKHASEIAAIVKSFDRERPIVVAGDFNSVSSFRAPKLLTEIGFIDAFAASHENPDTQPTWHWPTRPLSLALRIDYIFHSEHLVTTESQIIRRDGSDHSLVVAELRRTKQR